jgi:hypothetical protein
MIQDEIDRLGLLSTLLAVSVVHSRSGVISERGQFSFLGETLGQGPGTKMDEKRMVEEEEPGLKLRRDKGSWDNDRRRDG